MLQAIYIFLYGARDHISRVVNGHQFNAVQVYILDITCNAMLHQYKKVLYKKLFVQIIYFIFVIYSQTCTLIYAVLCTYYFNKLVYSKIQAFESLYSIKHNT